MVRFSTQAVAPPSKRTRVMVSEEGETADVVTVRPSTPAADLMGSYCATFDSDVLDCSICMEALTPPIYQCSNGHIACQGCLLRMNDTCPSCSQPIGKIRCLSIEKLIETMRVKCKYSSYGCEEMPKFIEKNTHEASCSHLPFNCPIKQCEFAASAPEVVAHLFGSSHRLTTHCVPLGKWYPEVYLNTAATTVMLLYVEGATFLLHQEKQNLGTLVYISYFNERQQVNYWYQLRVKNVKEASLSLETSPYCIEATDSSNSSIISSSNNHIDKEFLLVPHFMFPQGQIHLEIKIEFRSKTKPASR